MNRKQLHDILGEYFTHRRDFVVRIFLPKVKEKLENKLEELHGQKFLVRFKSKEVKELVQSYGVSERDFYNALLDAIIEQYQTEENVRKEVDQWLKENISQLL